MGEQPLRAADDTQSGGRGAPPGAFSCAPRLSRRAQARVLWIDDDVDPRSTESDRESSTEGPGTGRDPAAGHPAPPAIPTWVAVEALGPQSRAGRPSNP